MSAASDAAQGAVEQAVNAADTYPPQGGDAMAIAQVRALAAIALAVDRLASAVEDLWPPPES